MAWKSGSQTPSSNKLSLTRFRGLDSIHGGAASSLGHPTNVQLLNSPIKIFTIRTLKKTFKLVKLCTEQKTWIKAHPLWHPGKGQRILWRDLQPVEGGHCIYKTAQKGRQGW
ncbi:hypothetical protein CEXT_716251 [Caerostris extrusa]|uniref:Ribosomal protein S12 n=1 Tax=Caerostris extrusa TaxID=172846 RepID=A0AAV4V2X1_CAEEX|nr:hypothetical protein CEXT_716251 [Caerostris extrusa]